MVAQNLRPSTEGSGDEKVLIKEHVVLIIVVYISWAWVKLQPNEH